ASSCDKRAIELFAKDPKSKEGDDLWRKAFRYYSLSMKPKLKDNAAARKGELQTLGDRFFLMGQHFNGIPEKTTSFVTWRGQVTEPQYFEAAVEIYGASVALVPSYLGSIYQARALGFLGRYREASAIYQKLVDQEQLVDVVKTELNKSVLSSRPALLSAYLESGVAEYLQAQASTDPGERADHYTRANGVFDVIVNSLKSSKTEPNEQWWRAKYYQLRALVDEGQYKRADILLRDLERTTNDFDENKYGLRDLFKKMKSELAGKVFDNNSPSGNAP